METIKLPRTLGEVASFRNGLNFAANEKGKGCPMIGVSDFADVTSLDYKELDQINGAALAQPEDYLQANDLLFVRSNGNKRLVGRSLFIESNQPALFSGFCIRARLDKKKFDPKFFYYFTKTETFKDSISASGGSNIQNLNQGILRGVKLPSVSLGYQECVADFLSSIDKKIELNQRINAELEALARTIYDYWFVQFDFPDENGRPYKSSGGAMEWSEVLKRQIPAGWEVGSLNDLGQIAGGSTPPRRDASNFGDGMIPWITPKDLSNNKDNKFIGRGETDVSEAGKRAASLRLFPAGTVLMSSRAPVGYLAIALDEVTTNQGFKSFIPSKGYGSSFIYYAVNRALPAIIQYASGSTFSEISGGVLKAIGTALPPKPLVEMFCKRLAPIIERQKNAEIESRQLTELRDWLLPMLMNGQVRVA